MRVRVLAILTAAVLTSPAQADVTLVGVGTIPGDASDLSGLPGKQTDGTPHDRLGGLGSAVAYTGHGNAYVLASDRGPKDRATDFVCRVHTMDIVVVPGGNPAVALKLTATMLLTDESGRRFVGTAAAFGPTRTMRLDPEGIRVSRTGTLLLADEYGPFLYEFDRAGKRLRSLPVPKHFRPTKPSKHPEDELPPRNTVGRQPNRGMEGLAISPDGGNLFGLMQSPLIQDGALDKDNKRVGVNCRLLQLDLATGKTREFVYRLDHHETGVSEIVALTARQFLVLERDSRAGADARTKKLFRIDLDGATDVSQTAALPAGVKAVRKRPFLDLLDPKFGLAGAHLPEKFEGLAFGPDLPDGRRLLVVTADNDFVASVPFRVYAFAVDRSDLLEYESQQLDGVK